MKTIIDLIQTAKDMFATNSDWSREAQLANRACEDGDIKAFEKYNNPKNYLLDKANCLMYCCFKNQTDMYKYLLTKPEFLADERVQKSFNSHLLGASARDNLDLVKFLLSPKFKKHVDMYHDDGQVLRVATMNKVFEYLLYDKEFIVSPNLSAWFKANSPSSLREIEKRDLLFNLDKNLDEKIKSTKSLKI